jgi:hypothetical protein
MPFKLEVVKGFFLFMKDFEKGFLVRTDIIHSRPGCHQAMHYYK